MSIERVGGRLKRKREHEEEYKDEPIKSSVTVYDLVSRVHPDFDVLRPYAQRVVDSHKAGMQALSEWKDTQEAHAENVVKHFKKFKYMKSELEKVRGFRSGSRGERMSALAIGTAPRRPDVDVLEFLDLAGSKKRKTSGKGRYRMRGRGGFFSDIAGAIF